MEEREGETTAAKAESIDLKDPDETVEDADISIKLLHPPPLDHTNTFLSPTSSLSFDVDAFLLSRAPGSTLGEITADLEDYSLQLQNQLQIVVDRDYKGFVSLGSALKAERPRIARLDWKVTPPLALRENGQDPEKVKLNGFSSEDENFQHIKASAEASGSNLGLDKVRLEVVDVRNDLRNAEEQVQDVIQRRKRAELQKANLALLMTLNDSLKRLESLLGSPTVERNNDPERDSSTAHSRGKEDSYYQMFHVLDDVDDEDADQEFSEEAPSSVNLHDSLPRRPSLLGRRTSSKYKQRVTSDSSFLRKTSNGPNETLKEIDASHTIKTDLPTLIARASSEHASLIFLRERAASIGYVAYLAAHEGRFSHVRELLKENLRQLIIMLTRYDGASLLVGRSEHKRGEAYKQDETMLDSWTKDLSSLKERQVQHSLWLRSALRTWCDLEPSDAESGRNSAAEVEDIIRTATISSWVQENINTEKLDGLSIVPQTPKTPAVFGQSAYFSDQQEHSEQNSTSDLLMLSDLVHSPLDDEQSHNLIRLYNDILHFVFTHTSEISAASEQVLMQKRDLHSSTATKGDIKRSQCDIYVHVVWDTIARQLMEQLGGQLFFAGRPDVFHRNYTTSMAFFTAFERLAPSTRAKSALHKSPSYLAFRKRWQLPVYFQIRLRNAITQLERALSSSAGSQFGVPQSHSLPMMEATRQTIDLFASPWQKDKHIMELAHRQWRLSLQILTRYRNWIEEELPSDIILSNRRIAQDTPNDLIRTSSPTRAGTPTLQDSKADDALLSSFTVIAADLIWLEKEIKASFQSEIMPLFEKEGDTTRISKVLGDTLIKTLDSQKKIVPLLSTRITLILKSRCAEPLRLVRSVSTQFRTQPANSTNTAEPSSFVVQFLRPIRQYLGISEGKNSAHNDGVVSRFLDRETKSQWMTEVMEDFVAKYAASLRTMNKNYESLRRFKRGNMASVTGSGFGSLFSRGNTASPNVVKVEEEDPEANRMHNQMTLDVECLAKDVKGLSIVGADISTDTAAWQRLREAARGEQDDM